MTEFYEESNILQDNKSQVMVQLAHRMIMQTREWTNISHHPQLEVGLLHAYYVQHVYPRHSHDYYVICLIERGHQSFMHRGTQYSTSAGGVIFINPGAVHTGEAADGQGFEMRSLYPTTSLMEIALIELTGRRQGLPFFRDVRVDHRWAAQSILSLHKAISRGASTLESESRLLWTLAQLIKRYGDAHSAEQPLGKERKAVQDARRYIDEHFAESLTLGQLAQHVALSPYYLLRVFHAEVGMPPYAYLESARIRQAQRLIEAGKPLAEVALEVGFSSQSQLTRHFKKIIGVPPGQYARQTKF